MYRELLGWMFRKTMHLYESTSAFSKASCRLRKNLGTAVTSGRPLSRAPANTQTHALSAPVVAKTACFLRLNLRFDLLLRGTLAACSALAISQGYSIKACFKGKTLSVARKFWWMTGDRGLKPGAKLLSNDNPMTPRQSRSKGSFRRDSISHRENS
jgi:hypothetical protein